MVMQKKQIIQFAVLLVLIAVLAGAYVGIRSYNTKQKEKTKQVKEAAVITLTSFGKDDVTKIRYDYDNNTYKFEKDGDTWTDANDSDLVIDEDLFGDFLESAGSVEAEAEVEAQEGEDYGFDKPSRTVSITTSKGESSLIFGSFNEMLSQYYLKTSENGKIYLVEESVYTTFDKNPEDFKAEEDTKTDTDKETDGETDNAKEE